MINTAQARTLLKLFPVLGTLNDKARQSLFEAGQIVDLPQGQMLLQPTTRNASIYRLCCQASCASSSCRPTAAK